MIDTTHLQKKFAIARRRIPYAAATATALLIIATILYVFSEKNPAMEVAALIIGMAGIPIAGIILVKYPDIETISLEYKKLVIPQLLAETGFSGKYIHNLAVRMSDVSDSGLYREEAHALRCEDGLMGILGKAKVKIVQLNILVRSGSGSPIPGTPSSSIETSHFFGWFGRITTTQTLPGKVWILPLQVQVSGEQDDALKFTLSYLRRFSQYAFRALGDDDFSHRFEVYSDTPGLADRLLDETFRKKLVEIDKSFPFATGFSFSGNSIFFMTAATGDPLDLTAFTGPDEKTITKHRDEIHRLVNTTKVLLRLS